MHHPVRSRRLAAGLALSLALAGAAACGDDDEARDDTPSVAEQTAVTPAACDDLAAVGGALAGDPAAADALLDAFEASAPGALADDATALADAYRALAGGGAPTAFGDPAVVRASDRLADAYFAGCDLAAELDVDGVDYGFEGLPDRVDAGRIGLRFTNATDHDEPHELVLFRKAPGTTESADALLALPEEEAMGKLQMAGVVFADRPEQTAAVLLDLEPGDYVAVCFLPTGGGQDGPPHFTQGMVAEFTAS